MLFGERTCKTNGRLRLVYLTDPLRRAMAVWQFDLYFIHIGAPPPDTSGEDWDAPTLPPEQVRQAQERLAYYFGPPWFMLDDWLVFGPENGNRIDIQFDEEHYASIFVRCDVRSEAPQFLSLVADLAQILDCMLFSIDNEQLIPANAQRLLLEVGQRSSDLDAAHMKDIE